MGQPNYLGIDHVVIRTWDTQLFDLLSGPLGLPITWPLQRADFASFGWVGAGNVHLEVWAATDNSDLPNCTLPRIQQIAFAPDNLAESKARLEAACLHCNTPRTFRSKTKHGELHTNFTNSVILDLSSEACCVFFCDWDRDAPIVPWPNGQTTLQRLQRRELRLRACGGGHLGIVGLREIAIQTTSVKSRSIQWGILTQSDKSSLMLTAEIKLQLSAGAQDAITSLTFGVADLTCTKRFLQSKGLLDLSEMDCVALASAMTGGVSLRFTQA